MAQLDLADGRRQDRADAAFEASLGQVDCCPARGRSGPRAVRPSVPTARCRRLGDFPADVDVDRDVLLVAREHLAGRRIEQLHAAIEPSRQIDRPGKLEVGSAIGLAIVDLHDVAKPLDDHRLALVDKDHARRRQSQQESRSAKSPMRRAKRPSGEGLSPSGGVERCASELVRTAIDHGFGFSAGLSDWTRSGELPRLDGSDSARPVRRDVGRRLELVLCSALLAGLRRFRRRSTGLRSRPRGADRRSASRRGRRGRAACGRRPWGRRSSPPDPESESMMACQ